MSSNEMRQTVAPRAVTIVVGGDIAPIHRNRPLFESGDGLALLGDLRGVVAGADLAVANLEAPLIRTKRPIAKAGPVLGCPEQCVRGVAALGFQWLNLANNHIMDHGKDGLDNTISVCRGAGLHVFGAGDNRAAASMPCVVDTAGYKIGLVGVADREFSIAGEHSPGAMPLDPIFLGRQLSALSSTAACVVLVHRGVRDYPYPSPRLQQLCRNIVEFGASVVVCQHSHCPGCVECYKGSLIVYGQGNLIFDLGPHPPRSWCEGFLLEVVLDRRNVKSYRIIPYIQSRDAPGARMMTPDQSERFLGVLHRRSEDISSPLFVKREWKRFCALKSNSYIEALQGGGLRNRLIRRICHELGLNWQPLTLNQRTVLGNMLRCEDLREVLEEILLGDLPA